MDKFFWIKRKIFYVKKNKKFELEISAKIIYLFHFFILAEFDCCKWWKRKRILSQIRKLWKDRKL